LHPCYLVAEKSLQAPPRWFKKSNQGAGKRTTKFCEEFRKKSQFIKVWLEWPKFGQKEDTGYRSKKIFVQDVDGLDTGLGLSGQNWDKKRTPAAAFWIDVSSTQIKFADEKLAADVTASKSSAGTRKNGFWHPAKYGRNVRLNIWRKLIGDNFCSVNLRPFKIWLTAEFTSKKVWLRLLINVSVPRKKSNLCKKLTTGHGKAGFRPAIGQNDWLYGLGNGENGENSWLWYFGKI
jgi:hypothetical protein